MNQVQRPSTAGEPATARRSLPRFFSPFRIPAYRRLAVALALTSFASGVWLVALIWEIIRIGGGTTETSWVTTASAIGIVLPALLAGVVADRVPQKRILIVVAAVQATGMGLVAALSLMGLTEIWHLIVIAGLTALATAFYYPAYSAWLPALVPAKDLLAVNGFEGVVRPTIMQALGPAVAGAAIASLSPGAALSIAAGAEAIGIVALLRVPQTPVRRDLSVAGGGSPVRAAMRDIRDGFVYMVRTPWLLATLAFASAMTLVVMGPLEVLTPFLIKDELGGDATGHAWVLAAFGVGGALGALLVGSMRMPRRYLTVMNLCWGVACLPFLVVSATTTLWPVIVAALVLGALFGAPTVIWGTLLQRRVPPELLGRVASLDFFVSLALMPVSMALAAPVANAIGIRTTFAVAGVLPILFAVIAIVAARLPRDEIAHPLRDED